MRQYEAGNPPTKKPCFDIEKSRIILGQWQAMPENEFVTNPTFGDKVWSRIESPGWCAFVDGIFWGEISLVKIHQLEFVQGLWKMTPTHSSCILSICLRDIPFQKLPTPFADCLISLRNGTLMIPDDPKEEVVSKGRRQQVCWDITDKSRGVSLGGCFRICYMSL